MTTHSNKSFRSSLLTLSVVGSVVTTLGLASLATAAGANSLGPSNSQRAATARAEAKKLLALTSLPTGAKVITSFQGGKKSPLAEPSTTSSDTDTVILSKGYLISGSAGVAAYIEAHKPKGSTLAGSGTSTEPGFKPVTTLEYSFATSGVLGVSSLIYSILPTSKGTEVRVDAESIYTPQKSKYAIVASGATTLKVNVTRDSNVTTNNTSEVDTTTAATIAAIIAKVNALPVQTPGYLNCPVDLGAAVTLSFFTSGATTPYAKVVASDGGCGFVSVTQYSSTGAVLGTGHDGGGGTLAAFVATELGISNFPGSTTP